MATTELIDRILQTLEMPLWGRWILKERISVSAGGAVFRIESKCMSRIETALLMIVPLTASQSHLTDEQKLAHIAGAKHSLSISLNSCFVCGDVPILSHIRMRTYAKL